MSQKFNNPTTLTTNQEKLFHENYYNKFDTYIFKHFFEFECSTTSSANCRYASCHTFLLGQFQKIVHFTSWESDEMQCTYPIANFYIVHL